MSNSRDTLIAYLATILAIVIVFIGSLIAAVWLHPQEALIAQLGFGTVLGGLLGALRSPSQRSLVPPDPKEP